MPRTVSPWTGLNSAQALELADRLSDPALLALEDHQAYFAVHVEYARSAVVSLAGNDLRRALRDAEISVVALRYAESRRSATDRRQDAGDGRLPARLDHLKHL